MTMSVMTVKRGLMTLIIFSMAMIALLYWGRLEDLQAALRSTKYRTTDSLWTWACEDDQCIRYERDRKPILTSLATCRMQCGVAPLWPRPTGIVNLGTRSSPFRLQDIRFEISQNVKNLNVRSFLVQTCEIFRKNIEILVPKDSFIAKKRKWLSELVIVLNIVGRNEESLLFLNTNESYILGLRRYDSYARAEILAPSVFGARHGLETLSQIIWWGEGSLRILNKAYVKDQPKFAHRGVLIDTSRNYMTTAVIKRTIDGLAASKLNTLHWHLTDSQSFPFDSPRVPNMARHGAYSSDEMYKAGDISDVVAYARVRGVRVLVEIDAPAHAGNGWQWGQEAGLGNLSFCINKQPWSQFCGEPPCGQLNPDNMHTYEVLGNIYKDIVELANVTDMFHFGGDEVNLNCWASSLSEHDNEKLVHKWANFHARALNALKAAKQGKPPNAVILWSSQLTKRAREFLDKKVHVVQVWGPAKWREAEALLHDDFRVILSHVGPWYLDCGYGNWRAPGSGPCNPIHSWQSVYQHRPWESMKMPHQKLARILGGEVCLWSEMVDENSIDMKLWPRAAAFSERMWSDPEGEFSRDVPARFAVHRERLVTRGVRSDAIWPEWCNQNPYMCLEPVEPLEKN